MTKCAIMILILLAGVCSSCHSTHSGSASTGVGSIPKQATPSVMVTNGITPEQKASLDRMTSALGCTLAGDNRVDIWRKAVTERTKAIVAAGTMDMNQVKRLVCEQTEVEESNARKSRQALAEALHDLTTQAEFSPADPELRKSMDASLKNFLREVFDHAFTESRDRLIEESFRQATGTSQKPDPRDGRPALPIDQ